MMNLNEITKAFVKRVDKTSVYSVEWAGKTQGKFSDKKTAKDFCDNFNIRIYGEDEQNENPAMECEE